MNPPSTRPNRWRPIAVFNLLVGLLFSVSALGQPAFLKEGLVAYYPFDGNTIGNGSADLDFLNTSNAVFVEGNSGKDNDALHLNGSNAFSTESNTGFLNIFGAQKESSISLWVKPNKVTDAGQYFLCKGYKSGLNSFGNRFLTILEINGHVDFNLNNFTNHSLMSIPSNLIKIGSWQNITFVRSANFRVYLDGKEITSLCQIMNPGWTTDYNTVLDGTPLTIGALNNRISETEYIYNQYYKGSVSKLRFYSRGLSSDEVKALYDYESVPPDNSFITNGLVAYYPLNGDYLDKSENGNHGKSYNTDFAQNRFGASSSAIRVRGSENSRVEVLHSPSLKIDLKMSASFWVKNDRKWADGTITVLSKSTGILPDLFGWSCSIGESQGFGPGLTLFGPANGCCRNQSVGGRTDSFFSSAQPEWVHCVFVRDENDAWVYVNGGVVGYNRVSNLITSVDTVGSLIIGENPSVVSLLPVDRFVDDVRLYNRPLSSVEVMGLYRYESTNSAQFARVATATSQIINGFVVGAAIVDGGMGYTTNPVVAIIGGGGTGAKATATQFNGVVTSITITNPGSGYTSNPYITIAPPPFPPRKATATSQVVNGFVVGTKITDGGFGYDSPPAVLLIGGGGSGATAVATVANGVVTAITISNPGSGYTSSPIVRIASPPFAPSLAIEVSRVSVRLKVVLGRKYQLEASTDLKTWTSTGPAFVAQAEELAQEFDVNQVGKYFRINQVN